MGESIHIYARKDKYFIRYFFGRKLEPSPLHIRTMLII